MGLPVFILVHALLTNNLLNFENNVIPVKFKFIVVYRYSHSNTFEIAIETKRNNDNLPPVTARTQCAQHVD